MNNAGINELCLTLSQLQLPIPLQKKMAFGWLNGQLVGWLVDWLVGWLGWLDWLENWLGG